MMFVTVSFYGPRYELIHICLRCAGHIPTGSTIYNSPDQEQIQQLRDEVKELRALLQQYVPQAKQQNDAAQVAVAPATAVAASNNQNTAAVVTTAAPKKSPLSFSTASGAEVKLYGTLFQEVS